MQIVIDASTLLKGYFPDEEGFEKAKKILFLYSLGKLDLFAPSLIDYEISNAVFVAYKRKRINFDEAKDIQEKILNLDIEKHDLSFLKEELLDISKEFNISVYDASYLTLANKLKINLITGDKKFFNTVKNKAKNVIWIENF
ncbi:MAG TPA: PIN domain-containing protein [Candidatus Desulfofervidus auxilii]|uniref:PIN domain-containing protein n=1 Tax=Desulfofervidus auxilii TaxID=1621989 RepID=A0A7C0U2T5_DESA2|nr:type II toxin-antitoxin system VapC family toxin [Candidatus Desulfofervidus auxilii]HDD44484.1 PIN domain-containing protein [Candidatus Desulfofervidus auxilii]